MKDGYQKGMIAGAVAGLISGIVSDIIIATGFSFGLWGMSSPTSMIESGAILTVLAIIFGAIFGVIYVRFYSLIPGEGLMKGLYFGMMIWLIKDIAAGAYAALIMGAVAVGVSLIVGGVYMWIVYGLVIGALYKK